MYKIMDDSVKKPVNSYDSFDELYDPIDNLHDLKICSVYGSGEPVDWESMKSKIKNPKYVCRSCGRSTLDASSLCSPEIL